MTTIWKFPIRVADEQSVRMPEGAKILHVGVQNETPCLWAMVESTAPQESRIIAMRGTGHPASGLEGAAFLGTIFMYGGQLVFHVFEIGGRHAEA